MRIRSITYFIHPKWPVDEQAIQQAAAFSLAARQAYESAGFEVQTTRLANIPFPQILPELSSKNLHSLAQQMEAIVCQSDFEYVSLGPALPDKPQAYELIPETIGEPLKISSFQDLMTTPGGGVSLPATRACAQVIHDTATALSRWICEPALCRPGQCSRRSTLLPGIVSPGDNARLCPGHGSR